MGFGYDFWIERPDGLIGEDEWARVRDERDELLLDPDEPTGRQVVWRRMDHDDAFLEWCEPGRIFVAIGPDDMDDIEAMIELAGCWKADVLGESGEVYRSGGIVAG